MWLCCWMMKNLCSFKHIEFGYITSDWSYHSKTWENIFINGLNIGVCCQNCIGSRDIFWYHQWEGGVDYSIESLVLRSSNTVLVWYDVYDIFGWKRLSLLFEPQLRCHWSGWTFEDESFGWDMLCIGVELSSSAECHLQSFSIGGRVVYLDML